VDNTYQSVQLELGPRIVFFLNQGKNFLLSAGWNPYVKGTRNVSGTSADIAGTSYLVSLGFQVKITKKLFLGGSVNYHAIAITTETVDNTESTVTNSYTSLMPMIELSVRFK
jgi:hypothetical protein